MEKFSIIYADPPWSYRDKCSAGKRGAFYKYDLMDDADICRLPIGDLAADDCFLFIWVTFPKLQEGLDVIKSWGFEYKTMAFTWVKRNKKAQSWFWGMGRFTRSNPEVCLLATKGKPKRLSASVHSVIDTPIEEHSKKPACTRDRIVQLCGDLPRVELFARQTAEGWSSWGNQVETNEEINSALKL